MKKNKNIPLNLKEQINSRIGLICSIVVMLLLVLVFHQLDYQLIQKPADQAAKEAAKQKEEAEAAAKAPEISTATVVAVGDNLFHDSLIESGKSDSGTWNYDKIYENVKDEIQAADIAMVDQETVFTTDHDAVSGYPSFATPTEVGDALVNAGFDVIESATNHIDDYGYDYMAQTLNYWKTSHPDVPVLGIHETEEDANSVKVLEVNGIKISFLDYTYGTNNSGAGEGKEYMIDIFEKDKVASMIQKAKENSDVLIFVAHWGKEMEPMPTEYEKEWATFLMQQGVDVVIGGHPLPIQKCVIDYELDQEKNRIHVLCTVKTEGKTGVEMEALTGVQVTLLTIYDMCKAIDKHMVMSEIHLIEKTGGKSGDFRFEEEQ